MPRTDGNKKPACEAGFLQTEFRRNYTAAGRCVACLSPVAQPWHRYCPACRTWLRIGHAIRTMRAALRELRV